MIIPAVLKIKSRLACDPVSAAPGILPKRAVAFCTVSPSDSGPVHQSPPSFFNLHLHVASFFLPVLFQSIWDFSCGETTTHDALGNNSGILAPEIFRFAKTRGNIFSGLSFNNNPIALENAEPSLSSFPTMNLMSLQGPRGPSAQQQTGRFIISPSRPACKYSLGFRKLRVMDLFALNVLYFPGRKYPFP